MVTRSESATTVRRHGLRLPRWKTAKLYKLASFGMGISDALCLLAALGVAQAIHRGVGTPPASIALVLTAPILWIVVFHSFRLFEPQHLSPVEEFRRTVGASSLGILLLTMVTFWSKAPYSRTAVAVTWALALVLELMTRRMWRFQLARLKKDGKLALRTLIIGTNDDALRLGDALGNPIFGFKSVGYVGINGNHGEVSTLGSVHDIRRIIREHSAECLFVTSSAVSQDQILELTQAARYEHVEVRVAANLPQLLTTRVNIQTLGPVMSLSLRPMHLTPFQVAQKRAFDLVVASTTILLSLPLWAAIAAAIKVTSRGPVFFRQERVTESGKRFRIFKFRTMTDDPHHDPDAHSTPFFKDHADPRITRVGRLLRKWSLDELPQLLNVVRGEMSLVGPRPLPVSQVAANLTMLIPRLAVPAGMTGWWQVNGRNDVKPEDALQLDLFYIENWSLILDVYILLKTAVAVTARRGAV